MLAVVNTYCRFAGLDIKMKFLRIQSPPQERKVHANPSQRVTKDLTFVYHGKSEVFAIFHAK